MLIYQLSEKASKPVDTGSQFCQSAAILKRNPLRWLALLALTLVVSGCATLGQVTAEKQLAERAQQRWQALIEGNFDRAYEFETPGYRAVYSKKVFQNRFGGSVRWHSAEVREVSIDGDRAQVRMLIGYQTLTPQGETIDGERPIWERWQLVDGEWWYSER